MPVRTFLKSKLHGLTVTETRIDYEGSISLDPALMEAADILPHEQVDVYNITNGARFTTYAIAGRPGSGECGVNGAAARLASAGDRVIVVSYLGLENPEEWRRHRPIVKRIGEGNRLS
jgi:aspartate 1-decarboxylase